MSAANADTSSPNHKTGEMREDGIPGVLQMPLGLVFDRQEMRRERRSLPRFLLFLPFWSIGDTLGTTRPNNGIG
jgi:hypothetical protein